MSFLDRLNNLDRRVIFLFIGLAVALPLIFPLKIPFTVTDPVQSAYNFTENLPEGSVCVLTFDFYATTLTEMEPMATSVAKHMFSRNMKIVTYNLIPDGTALSMRIMKKVAAEYGKKYGIDYVNLGYRPGVVVAIKSFDEDIYETFPSDASGTPIETIPMMKNIRNSKDIDFVFCISDNASINSHIIMDQSEKGIPVAGGCTAVSAPEMYPYLNSGQLIGLLGGLKGAAEYEMLIKQPGIAVRCMDAQSIAHFTIVFFILIANISYFMTLKKSGKK